jgi:hypothetical protein
MGLEAIVSKVGWGVARGVGRGGTHPASKWGLRNLFFRHPIESGCMDGHKTPLETNMVLGTTTRCTICLLQVSATQRKLRKQWRKIYDVIYTLITLTHATRHWARVALIFSLYPHAHSSNHFYHNYAVEFGLGKTHNYCFQIFRLCQIIFSTIIFHFQWFILI